MKATYGQQVNGKRITLDEFVSKVRHDYDRIGLETIATAAKIKSLYNKGYSVEDAVSYLIMKS